MARPELAPLRIGIDAHTIGNRRSGDESYTVGLIRGLARIDDRNLYTLYTTSDAAADVLGPLPDNWRVQRVRPHQRYARIMLSLPWTLRRDRVDVAHFQYIAPPGLSCALVLTVHDVSFEVFPQYFSPVERVGLRWGTSLNIRRADRVITVSDFSKQQLMDIYGLEPDLIAVTHNAVAEDFEARAVAGAGQDVRQRLGLERDFVLWVGNFVRRKRPDVLVEAFEQLVKDPGFDCDLVMAGSLGGIYPEIRDAVAKAGLDDRVKFTGYVAPDDLPRLYQQARVFVFPSEYEGFGIPVLEAMSCGAPVVCAGGSSLGEVAGDAAVVLPEVTPASLAAALRAVVSSEAKRSDLARRGLARAASFSWDETARRTKRVYEDAFLARSASASGGRR